MTPSIRTDLLGQSAIALAELVRSGEVRPLDVVHAHLERIEALDAEIGAFQLVRWERALAEAEELGRRNDLRTLPLAGVPLAIKDNIAVAGEPMRVGSAATPDAPSEADDETVRRLRAAGAVVLGTTRVPELCIWGATDNVYGITRNPWNAELGVGGSSGGGAAAVAAGMVPLALGNDGLGSIRIPAAACGVFGLKPGGGVVPADIGVSCLCGMSENGPLATTVEDAALMLSVLADRPELRSPGPPDCPLRIAISTRPPALGIPVDPAFRDAATESGRLLADAGHQVEEADPPTIPLRIVRAIYAHWFAGVAEDAAALDSGRLEPRTRRHAALGRLARRLGLVREADRAAWRRLLEEFFAGYDLLLTPALAAPPLPAAGWSRRSWLANLIANTRFAPFAGPWNFAGYPAAAVPAGMHPVGVPLSVQLVAPDGGEALILSVARQLEALRPWPRHAPPVGP